MPMAVSQVFEECGLLDVGLVPQAPHNLRQHAQGSGWPCGNQRGLRITPYLMLLEVGARQPKHFSKRASEMF